MLFCLPTFVIFGISILNRPHALNGQSKAQIDEGLTETTLYPRLAELLAEFYNIVPEFERSQAKNVFDKMKAEIDAAKGEAEAAKGEAKAAKVEAKAAKAEADDLRVRGGDLYKIALDESRKSIYRGFTCAIDNMKSLSDSVFERYGLKNLKTEGMDVVQWPIGFIEVMMLSDFYKYTDTAPARYDFRGVEKSYLRWYHCVNNTGKVHNTALSKLLHDRLMEYYFKKQPEYSKISYLQDHYHNGTTFCRYVAAVLTRMYKLGCLFEHGLQAKFVSLHKEKHQLPFSTVLFELMPTYFITEDYIDIINIVWETSGLVVPPMTVGKKFERLFLLPGSTTSTKATVVLPFMRNCYEEDGRLIPGLTPLPESLTPPTELSH